MSKLESLTRYILGKTYITAKDYSDLGMRIFRFKSRAFVVIEIANNKVCFYNRELKNHPENLYLSSVLVSETSKYLPQNEWLVLTLCDENEQLIWAIVDSFYNATFEKLKRKKGGNRPNMQI